jgi:protein SCO1
MRSLDQLVFGNATMRSAIAAMAAAILSAIVPLQAQGAGRGESYFTNRPVLNQDGKTLQFYNDLIKDKIVVISFIYTSCQDICPITTARLAQVEEKLGDQVGRDIFLLSMSVDPARDTPNRLKAFAQAFRAGPGWQFITGQLADMRVINGKLGEKMRNLSDHRNEIVIGNESTGDWQRDNLFGDLDRVAEIIRSMNPKWREQSRVPSKENAEMAAIPFHGIPGQSLYLKLCASCHTVGKGDRVGPDLNGVTSRYSRTWLANYIQAPEQMRARQDAQALALVARYPVVRMPEMGLSEADASDVLAYIDLLTYQHHKKSSGSERKSSASKHQH